MTSPEELIELLDWKRRIFGLYQQIRETDPLTGWERWRAVRDEMFANHPQSPLDRDTRTTFTGLDLYPYDPKYRVTASITAEPPERYEIGTSGESTYAFERFGSVTFTIGTTVCSLELYWLDGYGGGLFLPFRDATSGKTTYGAGRYVLDTVKGADLGEVDGELVIDFNFSYNPSCAYDPRWVCPLAPPPNRLTVAIEAGEKAPALMPG